LVADGTDARWTAGLAAADHELAALLSFEGLLGRHAVHDRQQAKVGAADGAWAIRGLLWHRRIVARLLDISHVATDWCRDEGRS
jgi:hypothetical protein